jgi:uncharacterized protein YndB with AHSA1/START domain
MEITREVVLDAPIADVWEMLTDEDELSGWLADSVRFDPRPGAAGRFESGDDVWLTRVDEVEPGRRLRLAWWPETGGPLSEVTFTIAPDDERTERTRLIVVERVKGGVSLKGRSAGASPWDDRLLGLELRCLARASLAHC